MNKNKISKIILLIVTALLITCISTAVFADNQLDLGALEGNTTNNETDNTTDNETDDDVTDLSNSINTNTNTETDTNTNVETDTNANTNSNTSTYEESDIPYAGVEDTILMVAAFVVCGIIGVYTFMKMSDYSNI